MKRTALVALVLFGVVVVHDIMVEPRRAFGARAAVSAIDAYRRAISPRLSSIVTCRFIPTCSVHARATILKNGLLIGGGKSVVRIARCGPWTKAGTIDVP